MAIVESLRHCRYKSDDRVTMKRIKRHLAGRHNEKAKWDKLFAEKESRWVGRFEILQQLLLLVFIQMYERCTLAYRRKY